jgi:hypothetical protein
MRRRSQDSAAMKQNRAAAPASANGTAPLTVAPSSDAPRAERAPPIVDPRAVYFREHLRPFGLEIRGIRRERRLGRLRIGRRCGRIYILGEWLIEWLRAGEDVRQPRKPEEN